MHLRKTQRASQQAATAGRPSMLPGVALRSVAQVAVAARGESRGPHAKFPTSAHASLTGPRLTHAPAPCTRRLSRTSQPTNDPLRLVMDPLPEQAPQQNPGVSAGGSDRYVARVPSIAAATTQQSPQLAQSLISGPHQRMLWSALAQALRARRAWSS